MIRAVMICLMQAGFLLAAEPWFAGLVPPEATMVFGLDVARLKETPAGRRMLDVVLPAQWRFAEPPEFNPFTDLDELVMVDGPGGELYVLRGRIGQHQLPAVGFEFETDGHWQSDEEAVVWVSTVSGSEIAWTALLPGVAISGRPQEVRAALARRRKGLGTATIPVQVGRVDAWVYGETIRIVDLVDGVTGGLPGTVVLTFGASVSGRAVLKAASEEKAASEVAAWQEASTKAIEKGNRETRLLARAIQVQRSGTELRFEVSLANEDFERLLTVPLLGIHSRGRRIMPAAGAESEH